MVEQYTALESFVPVNPKLSCTNNAIQAADLY